MRSLQVKFLFILFTFFVAKTSEAQLKREMVILTPQIALSTSSKSFGLEAQIMVTDKLAMNYHISVGPEGIRVPGVVVLSVAFETLGFAFTFIPDGVSLHLPVVSDKIYFSPFVNPLGGNVVYTDYEWGKWGTFDSEVEMYFSLNFGAKAICYIGGRTIIAPFYRYTTAWNFGGYNMSELGFSIGWTLN
jgi:hypothetical protein